MKQILDSQIDMDEKVARELTRANDSTWYRR
jgi:hypothetical protein